jgi:hypothetical protein
MRPLGVRCTALLYCRIARQAEGLAGYFCRPTLSMKEPVMDFSCTATAAHGAAPNVVDSNPNPLLEPTTGGSPRLRTRQPEFGASLLPDELIGEVLQHLSLPDLASAYQVCRRWQAMEKSTAWVASAWTSIVRSINAPYKKLSASTFDDSLQYSRRLSAGCRSAALEQLAALVPLLPVQDWKQCLASLVQQAALCPAPSYHRVLGAIVSARITWDGSTEVCGNPAMSLQELFNEAWYAASRIPVFPVAAQAVMLAALCQYIRATSYGLELSKVVGTIALSWDEAQLEGQEEYGYARRLWTIATLNLPPRELLECLGQFNFHCLPFMSNAYPGRKTEEEIVAFAGAVMRMDLGRRKKLDMLLHRDHRGVPWLHQRCTADRSRKIKAYVRAMKRLGLSTAELAHLFAAEKFSGRPLLSVLLCRGIQDDNIKEALDWMDNLINEAGLPDSETVTLLRSYFKSRTHKDLEEDGPKSDAFPFFEFVPMYATPFNGLSAIDSLFSDKLGAKMKAYMEKILDSSLPDAVKRDVIRLDFPKRPMLVNMFWAHRIYCFVVRSSSLPDAMKQELTSPIHTQFDPTCSLV